MKRETKNYANESTADEVSNKRKKKRNTSDRIKRIDAFKVEVESLEKHDATQENKRGKKLRGDRKKAGRRSKIGVVESDKPDIASSECNGVNEAMENQLKNSRKKKRKSIESIKRINAFNEEGSTYETHDVIAGTRRKEKKRQALAKDLSKDNLLEKITEVAGEEVYQISSGDEDYSKGMKKWIMTYHQSRPGIQVLQERIDDYIVSHEAQEEQARKEREAQVVEGGWEVVKHHKGGKKTTDPGSGIAVGSVSQTAVLDKMAKKKNKEAALDFYRFQRREAHKNEILMLQSKFEQDKKRIQQMRAARKFRPY